MTEQQEKAEKAVADYRRQLEENGGIVDGALPTPRRSDFSVGLGKLLSGVRASTKGDTIGGPLAAFVLLGNSRALGDYRDTTGRAVKDTRLSPFFCFIVSFDYSVAATVKLNSSEKY
ncbi:hypothetical protein OUZ56_012076 [Daphnia magna]|uniref:Uncharacterized protein n=1 Tax=Daphnia magna TaxID=35525 RepID=A0ABQ9Z1Z0_9CRUS|nr:hypothetical protein OUZ56_012076 [Daphnia magna]